jgi:hypothetical protein
MATTPRMNRAIHVLRHYYRKLAEDIAQDIIDHESDFGSASFTEADNILEKHSRRLCDLGQVFHHLARYVPVKKPEGKEPLGRNDFRCFGCGDVIHEKDEECSNCGWTWKLLS